MAGTFLLLFGFVVADLITWVPTFLLRQNYPSILDAPVHQTVMTMFLGIALNLYIYAYVYKWVKKNTDMLITSGTVATLVFGAGIAVNWISIFFFMPWLILIGYLLKLTGYVLQQLHLKENFT